jgi:hypothetical protein
MTTQTLREKIDGGHVGGVLRLELRAARAAAKAIAEGYPEYMPIQMHILSEAKANSSFQKRENKMRVEINGLKSQLARRERSLEKANVYITDLKAKNRTLEEAVARL